MKPSPSGRHQTPVVSMRRGKPASRSAQAKLNTERRLADTGISMPASAASARPPAPAQFDDRAAGDRGSVGKADGGDAPAVTVEADDAPGPVFGAERAGLAAVGLQQAPAVEPAFAGAAPGAAGEVLRVEPGEARRGALLPSTARCRRPRGSAGHGSLRAPRRRLAREIEVAAFPQRDIRPLAVDREALPDPTQERDAEQRDADVHGARELLPDRGGRERRGRAAIGRVLLDDERPGRESPDRRGGDRRWKIPSPPRRR